MSKQAGNFGNLSSSYEFALGEMAGADFIQTLRGEANGNEKEGKVVR